MGSFEKHKEDRRGNNYFFNMVPDFMALFGRGTQAKCIPSSVGSGAGIGLWGLFFLAPTALHFFNEPADRCR
jgi:hypothetical protein